MFTYTFVPQKICFTKSVHGITPPARLFAKGRWKTQKKSKGHGVFTATPSTPVGMGNFLTGNML